MRLTFSHAAALLIYLCLLFFCFALILGMSGAPSTAAGIKVDFGEQVIGFAIIYMMFIGPVALALLIVYFALLRAKLISIVVLGVLTIGLGFVVFSFAVGDAGMRGWIGIAWAIVAPAFIHHLVFVALKP